MVALSQYPIIGVMGSGDPDGDDPVTEAVGRLIAESGCHLLTGAGSGVMTAAARGFCSVEGRQGLSIGIVPAKKAGSADTAPGYPNRFVELPIRTHLTTATDPDTLTSRNPVNILTAHGLVFRHGGAGTASELILAKRYERPLLLYLKDADRIGDFDRYSLRQFGPITDDINAVSRFIADIIEGIKLSRPRDIG